MVPIVKALLDLLATYLRLRVTGAFSFRASFFTELAWGLAYFAVLLIFWRIVFLNVKSIATWTLAEVLLFMAFLELFWSLTRGLFGATRYLWEFIKHAAIDAYLCRPADARLCLLLHNINVMVLVRGAVMSVLWLASSAAAGLELELTRLLGGLLVLAAGVLIYVEFSLTLNYLAFRWVNVRALDELLGGFWDLLRYPLDLAPALLRGLLTFVVPAIFTATFPTLVSLGRLPLSSTLALAIVVLLAWHVLQDAAWRAGLRYYESQGG